MTLPYDIARCQGATVQTTNERGCADCQRRTNPGRPEYQTHMLAPEIRNGQCPERMPPIQWTKP